MRFSEIFHNTFESTVQKYIESNIAAQVTLTPQTFPAIKQALLSKLPDYQVVCEHLDEIDNFTPNFGDTNSLNNFAQELCFKIFYNFNQNYALEYVSPLTIKQQDKIFVNTFPKIHANIPAISYQSTQQGYYQIYSTFALRQYEYLSPNDSCKAFKVENNDIVINCGACVGDSSIWFYQEGAAKVYSFEPMPIAFSYLKKNLKNLGYPEDLAIQLCVGNKNEELIFAEQTTHIGASHVITANDLQFFKDNQNINIVRAQSVRLDDWLKEQHIVPTLIKMDLEGAEQQALEGLEQTITQHKPKLAVCLYHKLSDMWTLPALIKKFNPEYTFYCKKSSTLAEFVLFAI